MKLRERIARRLLAILNVLFYWGAFTPPYTKEELAALKQMMDNDSSQQRPF